jgi:hypothetical protein
MKRASVFFGIFFLAAVSVFLFATREMPNRVMVKGPQIPMSALDKAGIMADSSPSNQIVLPEVIWAAASGGGTWKTEVQITDMTGSSIVQAWFYYAGGNGAHRDVVLWTGPGADHSVKYENILSTMQSIDTYFDYFGRVGTLWLWTQSSNNKILASAKTVNGNYGKTFPGLQWIDANTAQVGRDMVIQNLTNNATYRTGIGCFNATAGGWGMTVQFTLLDADNNTVGSPFTISFSQWEFKSFNPFIEAGVSVTDYDNIWLHIHPTFCQDPTPVFGLMCFGATANNISNDPSAHIAVQFQ